MPHVCRKSLTLRKQILKINMSMTNCHDTPMHCICMSLGLNVSKYILCPVEFYVCSSTCSGLKLHIMSIVLYDSRHCLNG